MAVSQSAAALSEPRAKNRSRYILLNTLTSYLDDVVDAITLLILTPMIILALGKESFGLWSLVWSFVGLFELADMGFGASVVKYIADAKGRNDIERQRTIVSTLFWIYVGLGAALMTSIVVSLLFFNKIFDIPASQRSAAEVVLVLLGARAALSMPLGMFRGVLIGYQKASVANGYKTLAAIFYFFVTLIMLLSSASLPALALISLAAGILPLLAMMIHSYKTLPGISVNLRFFDRTIIREVSTFSAYFTVIQVSRLIYTRVDSIIIKAFLPLQMVGVYAIAMKLSEKGAQFCFHLIKALTPVVAELHAAGEAQNIRAVWIRGTKLSVAFATPLLIGLAVLAGPLIINWTGPEFAPAIAACQWLVAASFLNVIHGNTSNVLSMGGEQRYLAFAMIASQIINILLSIVLIQPFGIAGVAAASLLASIPLQMGMIQRRASAIYSVPGWAFYRQTVLPSLFPALAMVVMFYAVQRVWTLTSMIQVAILEAAGIALFAMIFWLTGFSQSERAYFNDKVFRRLNIRRSK
jgi:O-antigen/teichoic acid export membrane protein